GEDDLAPAVDDDENREVLYFGEVQAGEVVLLQVRLPPLACGAFPHVSKDGTRPLQELRLVFLAENTLGQALALFLDQGLVQVRVRAGGIVPALIVRVLSLPAPEEVVKVAFSPGRADQQGPAAFVDETLAQVTFPDGRLESRGFINDDPIEAFAKKRNRI